MDDGMLSLASWEDGSGSRVELIFTAGRSGLLRGVELSSRELMGTDGLLDKASIFTALDLAYWFRCAFTSGAEAGMAMRTCISSVLCHLALRLLRLEGSFLHKEENFSSRLPRSEISKHWRQEYFPGIFSGLFLEGNFCFFFSETGSFVLVVEAYSFQFHMSDVTRRFQPIFKVSSFSFSSLDCTLLSP